MERGSPRIRVRGEANACHVPELNAKCPPEDISISDVAPTGLGNRP